MERIPGVRGFTIFLIFSNGFVSRTVANRYARAKQRSRHLFRTEGVQLSPTRRELS